MLTVRHGWWDTYFTEVRKEPVIARPTTTNRLANYQRQYRELAAQLAAQLADIGYIASGSITRRYTRCSTPGCRCHAEPPQRHGPYWQWTAKVNGKTVTRRLTEQQATTYQEWIDNDRQLRKVIGEMRKTAADATKLLLKDATKPDTKV